MKIKLLSLALLPFFCTSLFAQIELNPSIGTGEQAQNSDPICDIPLYLDDFNLSGVSEGELIPDFNLFDADGNEMVMSELLDEGKPVLLINGSYTCPVFRARESLINQIAEDWSNYIQIAIIYTVEAHPVVDISPYYGYENVTNENMMEGILYGQPATYGERVQVVKDMLSQMNFEVPVYIDGPCNEWWSHFGPAPHNAYLVDVDGRVASRHDWFHNYPNDIFCDLEILFGIPGDCSPQQVGGTFSFELTSNPKQSGPAGQTVSVYGLLSNESEQSVEIIIERKDEMLPAGWSSSMCTDVCYSPSTTETTILLEPGETLPYTNYFYTNDMPGEGSVQIAFVNSSDPDNRYLQLMEAETYLTTSSASVDQDRNIQVYPNPALAGNALNLEIPEYLLDGSSEIRLYDNQGREIKSWKAVTSEAELFLPRVPSGIYILRLLNQSGQTYSRKLEINEM